MKTYKRYIVRSEEGMIECDTIEQAFADREYMMDVCGSDYVEIFDTIENRFL